MFAPGSETCSPYKADNDLRASDGADSVDASLDDLLAEGQCLDEAAYACSGCPCARKPGRRRRCAVESATGAGARAGQRPAAEARDLRRCAGAPDTDSSRRRARARAPVVPPRAGLCKLLYNNQSLNKSAGM